MRTIYSNKVKLAHQNLYIPEASGFWSVKSSGEGNVDFDGAASETKHFEVADAGHISDYTIYIVTGGLLIAGVFAVFIFIMRGKKQRARGLVRASNFYIHLPVLIAA